MKKLNLTEATALALEGKLTIERKSLKKETLENKIGFYTKLPYDEIMEKAYTLEPNKKEFWEDLLKHIPNDRIDRVITWAELIIADPKNQK